MARLVNAQVPEVVQPFWAALQRGELIADAAVAAGTYRKQGTRWAAACGGVGPRRGHNLKGRCLSFTRTRRDRAGPRRGETIHVTARRAWATRRRRSRASCGDADRDSGYRATTAHAKAFERASCPKAAKLATNLRLREIVPRRSQAALVARADRPAAAPPLPRRPDNPEMGVCRDDLPVAVRAVRGPLRHELTLPAHRPRAAQARPCGWQRTNRIPSVLPPDP